MKWRYKTVMFLTLLIFCVGSVCATDQDPTDPFVKKLIDDNHQLNTKVYNQSIEIKNLAERLDKKDVEIQNLKDNNTQLDKRVKTLEDSNKQLVDSNKVLNNTVDNQSVIINSLKDDNKVLTDRVQALEYSKITQSNRIKSLEIDIQNLEESNRVLNNTVNNQSVIINELNNKLELQLNEIKQLQADKDKLNAEKCSIYEKLLSSPKKEDYEQLKKDIADKDNKIKELNTKIKTLNNILNINKKDVHNSLKGLSSTNIQNIKCGQYSFKLDDYLKIPLIKDGKKNVLKFKKDNGRLPKYVTIAGYKVPQNVYKKLYNL